MEQNPKEDQNPKKDQNPKIDLIPKKFETCWDTLYYGSSPSLYYCAAHKKIESPFLFIFD